MLWWKKSCGVVLGTLLVAVVSGFGCDGTESHVAPPGACATDPRGYPTFRAPSKDTGTCSEAQLGTFIEKCTGNTATEVTCQAFHDANTACSTCIFGANDFSVYGAYFDLVPYTPGYFSFLPNVTPACVTAYHDVFACDIIACRLCSAAELQGCDNKVLANDGACGKEYAAWTEACKDTVDQAGLKQGTDKADKDLKGFIRAFCGTPIGGVDAGTDAGTDAGDGGSSDAGADASDGSADASFDANND